MTFKDLKKSLETTIIQQQSKLLEICKDNPFWIWDIQAHKLQDIKTKGNCCFNHIIGLPTKDQMEKPIYDYQKILHDSSLISEFSNPLNHNFKHKHLWVKKATGLGVTEFFLIGGISPSATFGDTINLSNNINGLSVYPRIAVSGTSNNVYIVWADSMSREIYFKRSTDGGSTFGNSFNLSNNNGLSVYPRIAASTTSNDVYVVWADNSKGNYDILFKMMEELLSILQKT